MVLAAVMINAVVPSLAVACMYHNWTIRSMRSIIKSAGMVCQLGDTLKVV